MKKISRRKFIEKSAAGSLGVMAGISVQSKDQPYVEALYPMNRIPISMIIDDSTALVNMAHFGIPQFKEIFPDQYLQDWKRLPREIPDSFVREFGEWCRDQGIKGKYSMVPYPACTGWLHRFIPGWTGEDLKNSLKLVGDFMMEDWDIHPEMISHTRVININTGLPFPDATQDYMENWEWSQTKSMDELAGYISFALNVLREAGLSCEGVTTPGGFGSRNMENLAGGTLEAVREVFNTDIAHFFRDVRTGPEDKVTPELFHVSGLNSDDPKCSVHIIGCTNDWFGGWDGLSQGSPDRFITPDLLHGRMVEVIESGQPAIMVGHWPGFYFNGDKTGFNILKTVIKRLHEKYNHLVWMKNSEIARYQACKELTELAFNGKKLNLRAPFETKNFTLRINRKIRQARITIAGSTVTLNQAISPDKISSGMFFSDKQSGLLCFDLKRGESSIDIT